MSFVGARDGDGVLGLKGADAVDDAARARGRLIRHRVFTAADFGGLSIARRHVSTLADGVTLFTIWETKNGSISGAN
ncbi:MAG: hypothetical protein ABI885_26155, partial [Gammaproteobacteria bacterium]